MHIEKFTTVNEVSKLFYIYQQGDADPELAAAESKSGIYIGNTIARSLPYFLDFGSLLNPHIFIFGVTGSGKSYMMKSLVLKFSSIMGAAIVIIDFTGEYEKFAEFISAKSHEVAKGIDGLDDVAKTSHYFCLKGIKSEGERLEYADSILRELVGQVRKLKINAAARLFVFLDEAWKLAPRSRSLMTLLREGRKYGCGLVMASQVVEDMDLSMLSNFATIFIFRLQNRQSIEKLAKNYGLGLADEQAIQSLNLGSCMVIQVRKDRKVRASIIGKVHGFEIQNMFSIKSGDSMKIDIEKKIILDLLRESGVEMEKATAIVSAIEESAGIELKDLIVRAITSGAERLALLRGLRKIGVGEAELADSFASAICWIASRGSG
ncbi:MAG: type IV secretory system conjugative DNA transfer family protein [Candidatus Micrarchaeaceae archaeon]